MADTKRVLICVPCMDMVNAQFCQSLATLRRSCETQIIFQIGSLIYNSRNQLAGLAIKGGYDYTFWLDSDMVFAPETLEYMIEVLEEKNLDILSGLYFRRQPPFTPVIFSKLEINDEGCHWEDNIDIPDSLFEVEGIGFGCVLMRTEIFIEVFNKFVFFLLISCIKFRKNSIKFVNRLLSIINIGLEMSHCLFSFLCFFVEVLGVF